MKSPKFLLLLIVAVIYSCTKVIDDPQVTPTIVCSTVSYKTDITPIINQTCAIKSCQVSGTGEVDYTTYAGLKNDAINGKFKKEVLTNKSTNILFILLDSE